jgi:hypothetical protein
MRKRSEKFARVPKAKCYARENCQKKLGCYYRLEGWLQKEGYAENCYPMTLKL